MIKYDKYVVIYDNGGKTADRYTIIDKELIGHHYVSGGAVNVYSYVGSSQNPTHPQGFWQHGEIEVGPDDKLTELEHLGKIVKFGKLPVEVRNTLKNELHQDYGSQKAMQLLEILGSTHGGAGQVGDEYVVSDGYMAHAVPAQGNEQEIMNGRLDNEQLERAWDHYTGAEQTGGTVTIERAELKRAAAIAKRLSRGVATASMRFDNGVCTVVAFTEQHMGAAYVFQFKVACQGSMKTWTNANYNKTIVDNAKGTVTLRDGEAMKYGLVLVEAQAYRGVVMAMNLNGVHIVSLLNECGIEA